jgi:CHAT domain-containing protein
MASRTYQNFDLLLEAADGGGFRARVTSSPLGESPTGRFSLPFDGTQLENLLLKLDPGRSGTRRAGSDPHTQASMDLGGPLFETVFCEDIMLAWQRSQDYAREQGDGLRLRLRLTDAPSIAGLPWELLYDRRGNSFIAQSERTPVVRYLEVPQPPRPLAVDGALRILVVISSPTDLPELDVEAEWRRVQDALAGKVAEGTVKIDRLPAPTIQALSAWLRQHDVHVLHFIGHGDYDDRIQDGVVYFQDRYGRSSKVSPTVLGPYLRDHDPLRLVLLNACQSARVDTTDPFSGMAQGLVQQDCTAVVAMQFPISDGAATTFTGEFYGALADGFPVDQAATSARKALIAEYAAEWATPVLFLRAPDGRVFDHIVAQPEMTAVPTPPPAVEREDEARAAEALGTDAATTQTKRKSAPEPAAEPVEEPSPEPVKVPVEEKLEEKPAQKPAAAAASAGAGAAATVTVPTALTQPLPTTQPPTSPPPTTQQTGGPAYQQPQYPPPTYQTQPQYQQRPPSSEQSPKRTYPQPPQTGRTTPPPPKPRWGLIITIILAVVAVAFGGLAWYASTLSEKVEPNNGGQSSTLTGPKISAVRLTTGLTINGNASDWPENTPTFDSNTLVFGDEPGLAGRWGLAYDEKNFYFIVAVADPTAVQTHGKDTSQLFKGDGVSFEFGTAVPKNGNNSLETGDKHVLLGPAGGASSQVISAINVPSGSVFGRGQNSIQGFQAEVSRTDDGYVLEAAIPWSTLGAEDLAAGAEYGMNLNVSDSVASGSRTGELNAMVSNNPERKGNDAKFRSIWGTLTLQG